MAKQRKVRSILGETVDFDLMRVKQNIENRDKPDGVEMREKYIDIRRRRNPRRNVSDLVTEQRSNESDARDKIQQSKKNKQEALLAKDNEEVSKEEVEVTPTATVDTATVDTEAEMKSTPKKKIVKRNNTSEETTDQ